MVGPFEGAASDAGATGGSTRRQLAAAADVQAASDKAAEAATRNPPETACPDCVRAHHQHAPPRAGSSLGARRWDKVRQIMAKKS